MADPVPPSAARGGESIQPRGAGMQTFLTLALVVAALYFAREVLVPIALAVLLSFLLAPAVRWLRHLRAGRVTAVAITVLIAFQIILAFALIVGEEMSLLGPELPEYRHNIELKLRALPTAIPLQRVATVLHRVTAELKRSQASHPAPAGAPASAGGSKAEQAKPLP